MRFFINNMKLIADEIKKEDFDEIKAHYETMKAKKGKWMHRLIFTIVFFDNRFLFSIFSSVLTGISINIITNFLEFTEYDSKKQVKIIFLFIFTVIFICSLILFTSKINQIQESALSFGISGESHLKQNEIKQAKNNIVYYYCLRNIKYLVKICYINFFSGISVIMILFFWNQIVNKIREVYLWANCLFQK